MQQRIREEVNSFIFTKGARSFMSKKENKEMPSWYNPFSWIQSNGKCNQAQPQCSEGTKLNQGKPTWYNPFSWGAVCDEKQGKESPLSHQDKDK